MRLPSLLKAAGLVWALGLCLAASAQNWPSKPIRWIVPYTPGGITDNATRMVVQKISEQTGWTIVVDNKPGANSILGADLAAKSAPDGHTFLTVIGAHAANATLYAGRLPYDVVKSFAPVSLVGVAPLVMTVNNQLPVRNAKELIDYARANPGKVAFGSSGVGAAAHLTQELFKQVAGVDMVHVPYKGTAPADLMAGHVDLMLDTATCIPFVKSGKLRALAVASSKRNPALPNVPTFDELGVPNLYASSWYGLMGPAGLPPAMVQQLNSATNEVLRSPELLARMHELGAEVGGGSADDFARFIQSEIQRYADIVKKSGARME